MPGRKMPKGGGGIVGRDNIVKGNCPDGNIIRGENDKNGICCVHVSILYTKLDTDIHIMTFQIYIFAVSMTVV